MCRVLSEYLSGAKRFFQELSVVDAGNQEINSTIYGYVYIL